MLYPKGYITSQLGNRLIYDELNYDTNELKDNFNLLFQSLTDEQCKIFKTIMEAVNQEHGRIFFLYVASSGIASLLLPGGRTTHSKFKIPVQSLENSICKILQGSELAGLLKQTKLIIWDEAPMSHKFFFEAFDKSLGDITVILRGCRSDIVHATINSSYLWHHCTILNLTKNMCLQNDDNATEIREFSEWILKVGDGKLSEPNDGCVEVDIPKELLILHFDNPIEAIVSSTYLDLYLH
ncbi:hypothetical protein Lal_00022687 [Lupinus albus]|nr:hypothetical protein Lal_00022687 [Lupinus albus]